MVTNGSSQRLTRSEAAKSGNFRHSSVTSRSNACGSLYFCAISTSFNFSMLNGPRFLTTDTCRAAPLPLTAISTKSPFFRVLFSPRTIGLAPRSTGVTRQTWFCRSIVPNRFSPVSVRSPARRETALTQNPSAVFCSFPKNSSPTAGAGSRRLLLSGKFRFLYFPSRAAANGSPSLSTAVILNGT